MHNSIVAAVTLTLILAGATDAYTGEVRQVTDSKAVSFDWAMPDGTGGEIFVATSSNQFVGGGNPEHRYQIVSFDPTTGTGTPLTTFSSSLTHVRHNLSVSDDGQWLAFISHGDLVPGQNLNRSPEVFVVKRDGTMLAQLTNDSTPNAGSVTRLALAGSGNRIAFASSSDLTGENPQRVQQVFVIDRDGTSLTQMTQATEGEIQHLWISDDGARMAFAHNGDLTGSGNPEKNYEIFTIAMGDTSPRQVTSSVTGDSRAANISGDGSTIVFHSTADLTGNNSDGGLEIFAADWSTATVSQVTDSLGPGGRESRQGWPTNDGSQIFFASNQSPVLPFFWEVFKINTDGTGLTQLSNLGLVAEHPIVSGDGSRVAWWVDQGLYTATGSGANLLELIDRKTFDKSYMDITPDGERLAWSGMHDPLGTNPDGGEEIFVRGADGSNLTQVTDSGIAISSNPSITGDGSRIYFESTADFAGQNLEGNSEIFGLNADGSGAIQYTECDSTQWFSAHAQVSDDNSVLVFASVCDLTGGNADHSGEIFRIDTDGQNLTQLTSGPGPGGSVYVYWPRIDATGNWVVFSGNNDIDGGNPDNSFEVWRMQTNGTNLQRLTTDPVYSSFYPDVSSDGSRIVFVSQADLLGTNADHNSEIFLYETSGASTTQLTVTGGADNYNPRITRDGAYVYFLSEVQYFESDPDVGRIELYRYHIDTATLERAGGLGFENDPFLYWPAVSENGDRVLFNSIGDPTEQNPDEYWEIFLVDHTASNPIRIAPGPAPTTVSWNPEPGMIRYDVVRGDVASLQDGGSTVDLGVVVCIENDSPDTTTAGSEDQITPAAGQGFFYVYRGSMGLGAGAGSYGIGSSGLERTAASGDCSP